MKHVVIRHKTDFKEVLNGVNAQAAVMVLGPGESSSEEPENEHRRSEQWLYVIAGNGEVRNGKRKQRLSTGSLLLIEREEPHQITNTGRTPLVTLNIYAPIAYTRGGHVKLSARTPPLLSKIKRLGEKLRV
jgi:mannose-6-phosphate isomerase-like protein (cupin superfamily)